MNRRAVVALWVGLIATGFVLCKPPGVMAGVHVNVGINVPLPVLEIPDPPPVAVIPGTNVYFAPDVEADILFYHNYWYRPYQGRWYRAVGYNGPWAFVPVRAVPGVVLHLPPGYRHMPPGYERVPYGQMKKNWAHWERDRYWDNRARHEERHEAREQRRDDRREDRRDNGYRGGHGDHGDNGRHRGWDD